MKRNQKKYYQTLFNLVEPISIDGLHIDIPPVYGSALYRQHDDVPAHLIKKVLVGANQSNLSVGITLVWVTYIRASLFH